MSYARLTAAHEETSARLDGGVVVGGNGHALHKKQGCFCVAVGQPVGVPVLKR
jgi:hypothetical protein